MHQYSSNDMKKKECPICCRVQSEVHHMTLTNCRHTVCRSCLRSFMTYCRSSGLRCPVNGCNKLLEEAEVQDIVEHTRPSIESVPVANHWNWSSRSEKETSSRSEKKGESSSYFSSNDFPMLPSSAISKDTSNASSNKYRNIMDEPISSGPKSYESFKSKSKKEATGERHTEKHTNGKDWDPELQDRLRKLIADKMHKAVEFVLVASAADISLRVNMNPVNCLICEDYIRTNEGVSFPYCSSYFCRICLTQPESRANDVVLLYTNSADPNKNCAVIIDREMRRVLQESSFVRTNTVRSLVSIYENDNIEHSHHNKPTDIKKDYTLDNTSNQSYERSSLPGSISNEILLRNSNASSCEFCYKSIESMKGVILRSCYHVLCEGCLIATIMETLKTSVEVHCPMMQDNHRRCETIVQEREIKSLLTEKQYEIYERKCLEAAEDEFSTRVHCLKPTCTGWIVIEGYKESFVCPVCTSVNCLSCKAIHQGKSCRTYQNGQGHKENDDLPLTAKLMALDASLKIRCPSCRGDRLMPPSCNFIRCIDCKTVFSQPESKK